MSDPNVIEQPEARPVVACSDLLGRVMAEIEADAIECEKEAESHRLKEDKLNAYLMGTQAMAHRLDLARIKRVFAL
jgi:hypothetical protein